MCWFRYYRYVSSTQLKANNFTLTLSYCQYTLRKLIPHIWGTRLPNLYALPILPIPDHVPHNLEINKNKWLSIMPEKCQRDYTMYQRNSYKVLIFWLICLYLGEKYVLLSERFHSMSNCKQEVVRKLEAYSQ